MQLTPLDLAQSPIDKVYRRLGLIKSGRSVVDQQGDYGWRHAHPRGLRLLTHLQQRRASGVDQVIRDSIILMS